MSELAYLDLDLLVERAGPDYRVRVLASPAGGTKPVSFHLPFSDLEVENFLLKIGQPRANVRRAGRHQVTAIKNFGEGLFEAVFPEELHVKLAISQSRAEAIDAGLRIRLRFSDCPELSELPWEYLYDGEHNRFLCLSDHTPLVRYLEITDPVRVVPVTPPLRILVVIASPTDLPQLDGEKEWNNVTAALSELEQQGRVQVVRLAKPTLGALHSQLQRHTYHIFHFIGHGDFDTQTQGGMLAMEDDQGRARLVAGEELGTLLNNHRSLRLAVLNSCEGTRGDRNDPFSGTAQSLVQQGIPAVVAMQFEITDKAAITFGHALYEAIANGYPLDAATTEARIAVYADDNPTEWATPVLYLRAPDGRIFDIQPTSPEEQARHQAAAQAQQQAEERTRREAEERARQEAAEQQAQREAEERARQEAAEQQAQREAEERARQEAAEQQARQEAEERARQKARRRRRWLVPALAILAAVLATAGLFRWAPWQPDEGGPAPPVPPPVAPVAPVAPAGLTGKVSGAKIALRWNDAPSGSAEVAHWQVLRDREVLKKEVRVPQAIVPNEGFHSYTVVAVGKDRQASAESKGWHSPPTWQKLKTGFQEYSLAGVAAHNRELWVVGGMDGNGKRDEVLVFNPQTKKWKPGPKLPQPISHAPLVSTGGKLYLLGGLTETKADRDVPLATVYSLNTKTGGNWIEEEKLPAPRVGGAAAWDGERLIFAGGAETFAPNTQRPAAVEIWELRSGSWESFGAVLQPGRDRLAAATNGKGSIWFVGGAQLESPEPGRSPPPRKTYADVEVLRGNKISDSTPIRTAIHSAAAVWTPGTGTCVFGGLTVLPNQTAVPVAKVQCLEGTDPEWPDLPEVRQNAGAAIIDKTVYVVGSRSCSPCLAGAGNKPDVVLALRFG